MRRILRLWMMTALAVPILAGSVTAHGSTTVRTGTVVPPMPPLEKLCPSGLRVPFQTGEASHYAARFNGRKTAFGEIYDGARLTAAHRSLGNGEKILVRNLHNGKRVVVRVNDRGPFAGEKRGRVIDLSERAAELLGFHGGLARVAIYKCGK